MSNAYRYGHGAVRYAKALEAVLKPAQMIAAHTPWSGSYDNDWCHFCFAEPTSYEKPWPGHSDDCVWVALNHALTALATEGFSPTPKGSS